MGMIGGIGAVSAMIGTAGRAVRGVSEVFVPNASDGQRLGAAARGAALDQLSEEFSVVGQGLFDRCVDGLNRLPRPMLALGTLGLFVYAMVDPPGFAARMEGLAFVPDPLWWLLGAIVGFYFGARELHYRRAPNPPAPRAEAVHSAWIAPVTVPEAEAPPANDNPALRDWHGSTY
ncbi:hypothetical protein JSE7799_00588 [Jannaschia seosinensis]|uniref:Holin of 3TMs, for gene-transfer release n=1 Tax=Jannaschia seosinensis TaxID=313367 RepID=A0A0M7B4Z1_9RHOB|nr:holin family protein [Jannaschia seosinensis]CUH22111.1 hypothetical protein JSE7799_00588 [Jannaschia seosinensis]